MMGVKQRAKGERLQLQSKRWYIDCAIFYGEIMHRFCLIVFCFALFCGCESFSSADRPMRVTADQLQPGVIVPQLRTGVKVRISVLASGEPVMKEEIMEVSAGGDIATNFTTVYSTVYSTTNSTVCPIATLQFFQTTMFYRIS